MIILRDNQVEPHKLAVDFFSKTKGVKPSIIVAPTAFGKIKPTAFGKMKTYSYLCPMIRKSDKDYNSRKESTLNLLRKGDISLTKAAKLVKLDRQTITAWAKDDGLIFPVSDKKPINRDIFDEIDNEHKAYWLGFLYADGYVSDNNHIEITLKLSDEEHVLKFKEFMGFEGKIYKDSYRVRACFKDMKLGNRLKELGCVPRKSLILTFPNESQVSKHLLIHFIRGYFDGDGSIKDPKNCPFGASMIGTKHFLSGVLRFFKIDTAMNIKNSKGSMSVFQFQIFGDTARYVLESMYENATIYLERKKERYDNHVIKYAKRKNYL